MRPLPKLEIEHDTRYCSHRNANDRQPKHTSSNWPPLNVCARVARGRSVVVRIWRRDGFRRWAFRSRSSLSTAVEIRAVLLRFSLGFLEDVGRNLARAELELEHGGVGSASPAPHFPMRPQKSHSHVLRQVEEQRLLAGVELLRKDQQWLRAEISAVSGTPHADVDRLLLGHSGDAKRKQEPLPGSGGGVHCRTVAPGGDDGLLGNQRSLEHHGTL